MNIFKFIFLKVRYYLYYYLHLFFYKNFRQQRNNFENIPIIIISYNQLCYLEYLIIFLKKNGYHNIIIIDNDSTYPPLLKYFKEIQDYVTIHRLKENMGHRVLWKRKDLLKKYGQGYYVVTDPDILPVMECPSNFLEKFKEVLKRNPYVNKVGFSLCINDIPDSNRNKGKIIEWEKKFWIERDKYGNYIAPIDTTFALYRPAGIPPVYKNFYLGIRLGYPYCAKHGGWYVDSDNLNEEQEYYIKTTSDSSSWFSFREDGNLKKY